jgi:hypothetical protein
VNEAHVRARVEQLMVESLDYFASVARQGVTESGRGAVVVWEPKGESGFKTFKGSYMPESAPALSRIGPDGARLLREYKLTTEFLVVFITGDIDVLPVLAKQPGPGH